MPRPDDPQASAPWLAHYEPGVPAQLPAADARFEARFDAWVAGAAAVAPTFPAVTDGRRALHYAALNAAADRVTATFERDAFAPGDAVVVALPSGPTALAVILGALRAGALVAPVDGTDASAAAELTARLRAPLAIVLDRSAAAFGQALARAGAVVPRIVSVDPVRELRWPLRVLARLGGRRGVALSGTAAVPWHRWLAGDGASARSDDPPAGALWVDGVRYPQPQLAVGAQMLAAWLTDASPGDDTWLVLSPLSTPLGVVAALGTGPALRARIGLPGWWRSGDAVDALRYLRPAWVISDVGAVARLVAAPELGLSELRSVRGWLVDGPVPGPLVRAFAEATGIELCVGWAPRGAAGFVACNPVNGRRGAHTVGLPLPGVRAAMVDGALDVQAANLVAVDGTAEGLRVIGARLDDGGFIDVGSWGRGEGGAQPSATRA